MKAFNAITFVFSLLSLVLAQTVTVTNAAGASVVELVTTNALGQSITQTLQTLQPGSTTSNTATTATSTSAATAATSASTTSSSTTAAVTTPTQVQQGPVGQPATTPESAGGLTPYVYTTTDANGNFVTVSATFTPSFAATTPYTPTGSGTVLGYSVYLSMVGNHTAAAQAGNPASRAGVNLKLLLGAVSLLSVVISDIIGRSLVVLL
ncbi:hypothetical protein BJV74DRAFT_823462 [Russula compacta]|nr:hypothetical protein BJV74DRAFT_823462 [Russula compacta]